MSTENKKLNLMFTNVFFSAIKFFYIPPLKFFYTP